MKWKLLFVFYLTLLVVLASPRHGRAQNGLTDIVMKPGEKTLTIPFELQNNFIIVKVLLNGGIPLRFIFDTGAEHTIITKSAIASLANLEFGRRFELLGADLSTILYAYAVNRVRLDIGELHATNRVILVLEEDVFRFEEFSGVEVHGIAGSDLFRRFVVQIDYKLRLIHLHVPEHFSPPKGAQAIPALIYKHKAYLNCSIDSGSKKQDSLRFLIDTGASMAMLMYLLDADSTALPSRRIETNIGMGLGGYIRGYVGNVNRLTFSDYPLADVVTYFQEVDVLADTTEAMVKHGIIGNSILSRYTLYIDYIRSVVYVKPNRNWKQKFRYDKSGIVVSATEVGLKDFYIFQVLKGSPAEKADIRPGDHIIRLNGVPAYSFTLSDITRRFAGKEGTKVKLYIQRQNYTLHKTVVLKNLF